MNLKTTLFIFSLLFFSQIQFIHAQSKKEQIEVLNGRLDSLIRILENERGVSNQKLQVYENEIRDLKSQLSKIQLGLTNTKKELNILKVANDSLISLTDSLQNIPSLGTSKLDYEIIKSLIDIFYQDGRWTSCVMNYDDGEEKAYGFEAYLEVLSNTVIEKRDINQDGNLDAIVYIWLPWCSFTTAWEMSNSILFYSKGEEFLKNESLSSDIGKLLLNKLQAKERLDVGGIEVDFSSFGSYSDGTLIGEAIIWLNEPYDPPRFPSLKAEIIYNPFTGAWSYDLKKMND